MLADKLPILSVNWKLERYDEMSGLGTGEVLTAQLAPPRIVADVGLKPMRHDEAAQVQARIESLDGAINSFYLYDPRRKYPQADPAGTILGSFVPTIHTVGANNKSLRIDELPEAYTLTVGDYLAFDYGSNPVRRAFHRIVESATANSSGLTPLFEIRPHLRPGVAIDLVVTLKEPAAKVFIVPGSFNPGTAIGPWTEGMSFQVMQRP
ncbi:MAG: hypothetical protein ACT6U0_24390 [Shinella sp.]|uniref:hypothetical protein n=1 Tax=Shinella sp. TaxID=1870904 RepID=UPI004035A38E